MASSASKLAAARLQVEQAYTPPPPEILHRAPFDDERPSSSGRLVELARGRGFTTRELFGRGALPATWRKLDPDDPAPTYSSRIANFYRIGGLLKPLPLATPKLSSVYLRTLPDNSLVAFEVVWVDGSARYARSLLSSGKWIVDGVQAVTNRLKAI